MIPASSGRFDSGRSAGRSEMFMGQYENSIDAKNRMIVPSKFREELGFQCVLTKGIDKCLYIYTMSEWETFAEKLKALPVSNENARKFVRHFNASAVRCEIDKQGRMTIPQMLRKYAGIEKELVTIGIMNKIEIWSKSEWNEESNETEMDPAEVARNMEAYGI